MKRHLSESDVSVCQHRSSSCKLRLHRACCLPTGRQQGQHFVLYRRQTQIHDLKQAQNPSSIQLRSTLLDPAVNLLFQRMKTDLDSEKEKLEQAQNDLSAWKFTPDRWCCWFFSATLNDLLTTVLTSYVLFTRSLFCSKWIRSDTEIDRFCSHRTASFHEQSVYTEPFCCCPLLEAQVETRTGPRRHRIVYTTKKAEYLIEVLRTCTRPFTRYCCCRFSPFEISTQKML